MTFGPLKANSKRCVRLDQKLDDLLPFVSPITLFLDPYHPLDRYYVTAKTRRKLDTNFSRVQQASMQVTTLVQQALQTGVLSISTERQILHRLLCTPMDEQEKCALNQLTEALYRGLIQRSAEAYV